VPALLRQFFRTLRDSVRDLLPIVLVVAFFQGVVLRQPLPDLGELAVGALFVLLGLMLFVRGLEMALFPLGENMAYDFLRKGSPRGCCSSPSPSASAPPSPNPP